MAGVLVTGGAGYKGSVLVPALQARGHHVTVIDPCWFGLYLNGSSNLKILRSKIRDVPIDELMNIDIAILLHSVANDPCSELAPELTWETACQETELLLRSLSKTCCTKVIYASSASVYGVRADSIISEDLDPVALSVYNKTKVVAERIVLSYENFNPTILRPATVCGLSPRMRLDTVVNMLTMQAVKNKRISVLGGSQYRPNVHIDDLVNAYLFFTERPDISGIFNVGNDVRTVAEIASAIHQQFNCDIEYLESNDPRSYRLDTSKLMEMGFRYNKNIDDAISEVGQSIISNNLDDLDIWYNLKWMKNHLASL
jgi:nucleoside-diphosphate-sugar epimerase